MGIMVVVVWNSVKQNNTITQASPKTEPPIEEGTKAEASAHHRSEANADLYDKDKTQAMATRMMSNMKAQDLEISPTLIEAARGEINLITVMRR